MQGIWQMPLTRSLDARAFEVKKKKKKLGEGGREGVIGLLRRAQYSDRLVP